MDKAIVVNNQGINGNIGSCEVKSTNFSPDSWHTTTTAVNSCSGEIIAQSTYFDWGVIYFPLVIIFVIAGIIWRATWLTDF